jgi:hypothetical protein
MWPGLDPVIWKYVSRWLSSSLETVNDSINQMHILQFGAIAAIIVSAGFYFMFAKKA